MRIALILLAVITESVMLAGPASANPTGATIVNGQVTINPAGTVLTITNSPNSIINWQSFSIGANEITRFTQQSATSAVLNRVIGAGGSISPSTILGALQSNGRVFLINPSGIVFGAGSQIDVAGLVASSLNLSDADFLGGRLRFTEVPGAGAVVNQGTINAASGGQVYLVGPSVTNGGIITSPQGEVILAAGNSVELVNPGTPNLRVEITAPDNEATNLGQLIATSGRIGIYAGLVKSNGTLNADRAVTGPAGEILLKATSTVTVGGTITAIDGSVTVEAGGGISFENGAVVSTASATLLGPLCPASGPVCGTISPPPPVSIVSNPGQGIILIGQSDGNITAGTSAAGGSISINGGQITTTGNTSQGGTLTLVAGSGATTTSGAGIILVNDVFVPLTLLSRLVPAALSGSIDLLAQIPSGQVAHRGTAQIMGNISTISQVNDFTKTWGGTAPYTLTPPRTNLTFE